MHGGHGHLHAPQLGPRGDALGLHLELQSKQHLVTAEKASV